MYANVEVSKVVLMRYCTDTRYTATARVSFRVGRPQAVVGRTVLP